MVAVENWSAEWLGTDEQQSSDPAAAWLFDVAGNPVILPAEATGFRVRCLPPGSRGLGELVFDGKTGILLFVPRTTGPTEFAEMVGYRPGKYKLAAIDASYQYLRDVPVATFLVTPAMAAAHQAESAMGRAPAGFGAPSSSSEALGEIVRRELREASTASHTDPLVHDLVNALRTALSESLGVIRAQSADGTRHVSELVRASATVVTAADGAGISRREPPPVWAPPPPVVPAALPAPAPAPVEEAGGAANLGDFVSGAISSLAPLLQHVVNTKVFGMSDEMSLSAIRAMSGIGGMGGVANANATPATVSPSAETPSAASASAATAPSGEAAPSIHPSALWPHIAAVEKHLSASEAAIVRRYLVRAPGDQIAQLAREVMSRSASEAAAWIRSVLADVGGSGAEPAEPAATAPTEDPYS